MIERSHPIPLEVRERMSQARGSIWPDVERYARIRMTPAEILVALKIDHKATHPYPRVENALNKAWKRGILEKRTPEETRDARLDVLPEFRQDLFPRVALWLRVASAVEQGIIPAHPHTRMDWKKLISVFSIENTLPRRYRWVDAHFLLGED